MCTLFWNWVQFLEEATFLSRLSSSERCDLIIVGSLKKFKPTKWGMEFFGLKKDKGFPRRASHLLPIFRGVPPPPPGWEMSF